MAMVLMKEFELIRVYGLELKIYHDVTHKQGWKASYFSLQKNTPWLYEKRGFTREQAIDKIVGAVMDLTWEVCLDIQHESTQ